MDTVTRKLILSIISLVPKYKQFPMKQSELSEQLSIYVFILEFAKTSSANFSKRSRFAKINYTKFADSVQSAKISSAKFVDFEPSICKKLFR